MDKIEKLNALKALFNTDPEAFDKQILALLATSNNDFVDKSDGELISKKDATILIQNYYDVAIQTDRDPIVSYFIDKDRMLEVINTGAEQIQVILGRHTIGGNTLIFVGANRGDITTPGKHVYIKGDKLMQNIWPKRYSQEIKDHTWRASTVLENN